jgi:hypothetical protein
MSYCPAAHLFLFLVQWTDCNLAGALGLLRILIYKVVDTLVSQPCLFLLFFLLNWRMINIIVILKRRFMLMGQPPCPLMKGKQALGNFMV